MLMFSKDTQKQKIIFNMGIFHILTNNILIKDDTLFYITKMGVTGTHLPHGAGSLHWFWSQVVIGSQFNAAELV